MGDTRRAVPDILRGTLDVLILRALADRTQAHGYAVAKWIESATGDASRITNADVTFTGFRHADPCQAFDDQKVMRACAKQFESGRDW